MSASYPVAAPLALEYVRSLITLEVNDYKRSGHMKCSSLQMSYQVDLYIEMQTTWPSCFPSRRFATLKTEGQGFHVACWRNNVEVWTVSLTLNLIRLRMPSRPESTHTRRSTNQLGINIEIL